MTRRKKVSDELLRALRTDKKSALFVLTETASVEGKVVRYDHESLLIESQDAHHLVYRSNLTRISIPKPHIKGTIPEGIR